MEITVANPANQHAHQHFTRLRFCHFDLSNLEPLANFKKYGCLRLHVRNLLLNFGWIFSGLPVVNRRNLSAVQPRVNDPLVTFPLKTASEREAWIPDPVQECRRPLDS